MVSEGAADQECSPRAAQHGQKVFLLPCEGRLTGCNVGSGPDGTVVAAIPYLFSPRVEIHFVMTLLYEAENC